MPSDTADAGWCWLVLAHANWLLCTGSRRNVTWQVHTGPHWASLLAVLNLYRAISLILTASPHVWALHTRGKANGPNSIATHTQPNGYLACNRPMNVTVSSPLAAVRSVDVTVKASEPPQGVVVKAEHSGLWNGARPCAVCVRVCEREGEGESFVQLRHTHAPAVRVWANSQHQDLRQHTNLTLAEWFCHQGLFKGEHCASGVTANTTVFTVQLGRGNYRGQSGTVACTPHG